MKLVAVSSCPTGIAQTYMAAEALEQAGKAAGHEVHVETQGAAGSTPLDPAIIAAADGVIYAADLEVKDKDRFAGKPFIDVGVKKAVHDAPGVIAAAVAAVEAGVPAGGPAAPAAAPVTKVDRNAGVGTRIRQWLMTGVSYMIPFVAAGGILIALGFMAGFLALWISRWKVPKGVRGVMPVVVIPLLSTFVVGLVMFLIIGQPIASLMDGLSSWLNGLSGSNLILLGALLGAMMGFDLGGPINKVAYTFAVTGLATEGLATDAVQYRIMAAVMAAGMVAPLAMALATVVRKKLFTHAERENGKAAWLLGLSFISEGAIPFAAADPWRVIVSSLVGSSVTGALVMAVGSGQRAPHGGIWVLPLISNPLAFLMAVAVGMVISAGLVVALKSAKPNEFVQAEQAADAEALVATAA
jgi:fructose-specific phosphotransferase system IIB component